MTGDSRLARRFDLARPRLVALAARMLGSAADADDAVQEAWLRLERTDTDAIDNLDAWLTTVVSRICLDMLSSARRTRERSWQVESWDDPADDSHDPLAEAERSDSVTTALLLILDTLTPAERIAFVLHDVFGHPFDAVGAALSRSPESARQLASRARRRMRDASTVARRERERERRVIDAWLRAAREGDLAALLELLDEDAVLIADYGATGDELRGRDAIVSQATYAARLAENSVPVRIDGAPGVAARAGDTIASIMRFEVRGERIHRLEVLADPVRLREVRLPR